jgi:hypothetical protein
LPEVDEPLRTVGIQVEVPCVEVDAAVDVVLDQVEYHVGLVFVWSVDIHVETGLEVYLWVSTKAVEVWSFTVLDWACVTGHKVVYWEMVSVVTEPILPGQSVMVEAHDVIV